MYDTASVLMDFKFYLERKISNVQCGKLYRTEENLGKGAITIDFRNWRAIT